MINCDGSAANHVVNLLLCCLVGCGILEQVVEQE